MKLNRKQKDEIAKVFFNLSQIDFITLIIGNLVLGEKFSWTTAIIGGILFVVFLGAGIYFKGGE